MIEIKPIQSNSTLTVTDSTFYHPKQYDILTDNIKSIEDVALVLKALGIQITNVNPHLEELINHNLIKPKKD
jgi:hypothetical protein